VKILITGAGGFIGQALVSLFTHMDWQVYGIDRKAPSFELGSQVTWYSKQLPDKNFVALLNECRPDILVHTASSANVGQSLIDPLHDFEQSAGIWANILDSVKRSQASCKVIFLSSAAVYGNPQTLPVREDHSTKPVSPYGYHKKMCEELSEYYVRLYGLSVCSLRIFSAYGSGLQRQVMWDICQKALSNNSLELMGTGEEARDFIHVTDIAKAITYCIEKGDFEAGIYNVASGKSITIHDLANKIVNALGLSININFSGHQRGGDPLYWQADVSKLSSLGFKPDTSLDEGIYTYVQWILQKIMNKSDITV